MEPVIFMGALFIAGAITGAGERIASAIRSLK